MIPCHCAVQQCAWLSCVIVGAIVKLLQCEEWFAAIFNELRLGWTNLTEGGLSLSARPNSDFATILDALFARTDEDETPAAQPKVNFDYLAVAEELHSGRIRVAGDTVEAEYREAGSLESELAAILAEARTTPVPDAGVDDLPPADPAAIAVELALDTMPSADLGQLRRAFALRNHPDRVPPHLRERALARMQIANRLIDDARRKALAKTKR